MSTLVTRLDAAGRTWHDVTWSARLPDACSRKPHSSGPRIRDRTQTIKGHRAPARIKGGAPGGQASGCEKVKIYLMAEDEIILMQSSLSHKTAEDISVLGGS